MQNKPNEARHNSRRNFLLAVAVAVLLLGGYQIWRWNSIPPQLQASPEARKTLDAFFTAITARDKVKLATCMERIEKHIAEGRLGEKVKNELRTCYELANADSWETAAKRLYWVIFEQPY